MVNPEMPPIPGMGSMTDTLEFMKKLWGGMGVPGMSAQGGGMPGMPAGMPGMAGMAGMPGMNLPGMVMPTLSVEEINKKISDLKSVESWLTLNMNMLRGTVQALEVQAATLSALQSMGESFSATMNAAGQQASAYAAPNGSGAGAEEPEEEVDDSQETVQPTPRDEQDAAALTAPLVNAAAWWNVLQNQFQQAVGNAMTAEPATASQEDKDEEKAKPKAKPKPKSRTTAASKSRTSKK